MTVGRGVGFGRGVGTLDGRGRGITTVILELIGDGFGGRFHIFASSGRTSRLPSKGHRHVV